jgi:hypothetical protein
MKNIHILPTDKSSRLYLGNNGNFVFGMTQTSIQSKNDDFTNQNISITNSEEIKEGDWVITPTNDIIQWAKVFQPIGKKIILTTDQNLIKDGVQAIDDDFLEWFVKNQSCEEVRIEKWFDKSSDEENFIPIISKEEPLEEVALFIYPIHLIWDEEERYDCNQELRKTFMEGAKWQQERSYSEEEVEDLIYKVCGTVARLQGITLNGNYIHSAYKQYKKK